MVERGEGYHILGDLRTLGLAQLLPVLLLACIFRPLALLLCVAFKIHVAFIAFEYYNTYMCYYVF